MASINSLTASETLSLWNSYLSESMTFVVSKYFHSQAEDPQVKNMLEYAIGVSEEGAKTSKRFLEQAGHPLPQGFDENDVNWDAPKVYSDAYVTLLKNKLVQDATVVLTMALGSSSRPDIRHFFENQLKDGAKMISLCLDIIEKKGLDHPVRIPFPDVIEKVESPSFLGSLFHETRPLNTAEIFQLVSNFQGTAVINTLFKSFVQFSLVKEKGLDGLFQQGAEITDKHLDIFQTRLAESDLPQLPTWESEFNKSPISPLSDRIILFKTALILAATAGRYGVALSTVMRKDLGVDFMRLMTETLEFAGENMNEMIKREQFDQHPLAKR